MNIVKILFKGFAYCVWIGVSFYLILLVATSIPQLPLPQLAYNAYVITSGSMEPTIMTGDLIFSKPQPTYAIGDIITFQKPGAPTITHRVIALSTKETTSFITKGDNNEDPDTSPIPQEYVKGNYQLRLPAVGYALVYGKSPVGLAILIGLPSIVLIIETVVEKKPKRASSPHES